MKSKQTTFAGIAGLLIALGNAMNAAFDGNPATAIDIPAVLAQLTVCYGLLKARDHNVTSKQAGLVK